MEKLVSRKQIQEFQSGGVTLIPGLFSEWVETLCDGINANRKEPGKHAKIYTGENGDGKFFGDYCNWQRIPQYRDFIFNSQVAQIARQLMQSTKVQLFHEHVLVKEAQTGVATPWHQDQPYYSVAAPRTVSLWIALDEVPKERTLEFVRGSHQWGKLFRPERFNGQPLNDGDDQQSLPDIDGNKEKFDICGWQMKPGDAVAFDFRTVHGAPANTSVSEQRRAFSLRLVGDNAHYVRKDGMVTSPPFEHITLEDGAPVEAEDFPILLEA